MPRRPKPERSELFSVSVDFIPLTAEQRQRFAILLGVGADSPAISDTEDAVRAGRLDVARDVDAGRLVTAEGGAELAAILRAADALYAALKGASDQVEGLLGVDAIEPALDGVARLRPRVRRAQARHADQQEAEQKPEGIGRPMKLAARSLGERLVPIWRDHSRQRFNHRGAWRDFVREALQAAGISASAEHVAREVASNKVPAGNVEPREVESISRH